MKKRINLIFSKKDYLYNVHNFGKKCNLLFITGFVGSGKSTLAKKIAEEKKPLFYHRIGYHGVKYIKIIQLQ